MVTMFKRFWLDSVLLYCCNLPVTLLLLVNVSGKLIKLFKMAPFIFIFKAKRLFNQPSVDEYLLQPIFEMFSYSFINCFHNSIFTLNFGRQTAIAIADREEQQLNWRFDSTIVIWFHYLSYHSLRDYNQPIGKYYTYI